MASILPKGFYEGSDEAMLSIYKINQVIFEAIVMFPLKVFNFESGNYEYKKISFMRFIPHERNEHYKIFDESGFCRSTVDSLPVYFKEFERIVRQSNIELTCCYFQGNFLRQGWDVLYWIVIIL